MEFSQYLTFRSIATFSGLNYLQSGLSFLTSLLLARELGQYEYGYFTYGIIFTNTLSVITQFGLDKTLVRDLVQRKDSEKILYAASFLKLVLSILSILGVLLWMLVFSNFESARIYIVLLCTISGCLLGISPKAWFDVKGKIQEHAYILLLDRFIFFVGSMFFLFIFRNDMIIINVCIAMLLGRLVMSYYEWKFIKQSTELPIVKDLLGFVRSAVRTNLWVWFAAIGNLMMTHVNQLLVDLQMGPGELGLYGFALQLITLVKILQNQILRLSTPSISKVVEQEDYSLILRSFVKNCLLSLGSTILVLLPAFLLAPWFIRNFVGADFMAAVPVFNALCLWVLLFGVALIANQFLLSFHMQKAYFYTTVFFGLLSVYLAYVLIGAYGAVGAAFSLIIAHFGSIFIQTILVVRKIKNHSINRLTTDVQP